MVELGLVDCGMLYLNLDEVGMVKETKTALSHMTKRSFLQE